MNPTFISLSSLAMDLKRVAMGYHRGSNIMADRFLQEALDRKDEIDTTTIKPYLQNLLLKIDNLSLETDQQKKAEDALMYSTLFQNAALAL
jgi:hypothetical protein